VITEITKRNDDTETGGWVFYDAECPLCIDLAARFERVLARRGFRLAPLQEAWARRRLGLQSGAPLTEMRVLGTDGGSAGGADAVILLACKIWWAWPLCALARVPRMRTALHAGYRWVASRRNCLAGACARPTRTAWPGWLGLLVLPMLALLVRDALPAWAFMWALAGAIFFGCKWLTFRREVQRNGRVPRFRAFGYLFAWPGMDASSFLRGHLEHRPKLHAVLTASAKTLFGAILLFAVARTAPDPLLAGWLGMFGMIFVLHFGLFHLLALGWQAAGVDARPIMDAPIRAVSLAEFWGRRWNAAFNQLAFDFVFRPVARKTNAAIATLAVFAVSGLIHELLISLPARGGYGLPTAYFLLQGAGLIVERSRIGKRAGLARGFRGWLFTMLIVAGPAFWLFHPPFVHRVIVPFMHAIGAL
jgi:predicted DCC family thiol-disulfide oxidoreductase YuxK